MNEDQLKKLNDLRKQNNNADTNHLDILKTMNSSIQFLHDTPQIMDDLDIQFCTKTGLDDIDISLLFLATGLQVARQYLCTNDKFRISANDGDKLIESSLSLAPPNWKDVLTQSVPYDAITTGDHISGTGLAGTTHRYRTLGHDPILGWIFGTANIMTNSLTKTNFETLQVSQMRIIRHYPLGTAGMIERAISYSIDNPNLLLVSVARQATHFGSDYFTKQGLPLPLIATVDDHLAMKMITKWHIDMYSITRTLALSSMIDSIICLLHQLFYAGSSETDYKLYQVKTKKIILYSNMIASSSNVAIVALTKDISKLDVGGIGKTIYQYITNRKFIRSVKEDFIFGQYKNMFLDI